jgi:hypothetical protein
MNFQQILTKLKELKAKDDVIQNAVENFCNVIAPDSYPLIIEESKVQGFLEAFGIINPEIKDWLEYYIYEASNMTNPMVTDGDGNIFDFKFDEEVVKFLEKHYG